MDAIFIQNGTDSITKGKSFDGSKVTSFTHTDPTKSTVAAISANYYGFFVR